MAMYNRLCRLVSEYMRLAPSDMLQDNVDSLIGEATLRMVHTHEGCRVGCMVAAYSTPKQRKKLVKSMKGLVLKMCLDEFAYIALIKILQVVDDTELVRKSIVAEIQVSIRTLLSSLL
jgi:pumilio homology domain family member 6